jgi:hypothetical protein
MSTDRLHSRRLRTLFLLGAFSALTAATVAGCPGTIDDLTPFQGGACNVEGQLFQQKCSDSTCHNATDLAGTLDLVSPDLASRVVGQPGSVDCPGEILVDPADPENSLILTKLEDSPPCGNRMPLIGDPLTDQEKDCVLQWVQSLGTGGTTSAGGMGGAPMGGMGGAPMGGMGGAGGAGGTGGAAGN